MKFEKVLKAHCIIKVASLSLFYISHIYISFPHQTKGIMENFVPNLFQISSVSGREFQNLLTCKCKRKRAFTWRISVHSPTYTRKWKLGTTNSFLFNGPYSFCRRSLLRRTLFSIPNTTQQVWIFYL